MANVIKIEEAKQLLKTDSFPFAQYNFEFFYIVQFSILPFHYKDMNGVVAASTSAGNTIIGEIFGSYVVRSKKKKFIYLTPLKALAQEKIDDWTSESHHFSNLNLSICTGDYKIEGDRLKELQNSDIIIMTSEMLDHRLRMNKSEKSSF